MNKPDARESTGNPLMQTITFERSVFLPYSPEEVFRFHTSPDVMKKLVLPITFVQVLRDDRNSLTAGEIEFKLWMGPIPLHWLARHEPGPILTSFVDRLISGPVASWVHEHIMETASGGSKLTDRVTYQHHPGVRGLFTKLFFSRVSLSVLFRYRHWVTRKAVARGHQK